MTVDKPIDSKHFKCIKEDNSQEDDERQWELSKIVFDRFYEYLKKKGLKESTAEQRTDGAAFFIMRYVFVYEDVIDIRAISEETVRKYLGNWYIRKVMNSSIKEIKLNLTALSNFFTFLKENDHITEDHLRELKGICRDTEWFEMRFRTYFESEGEDFREWIEEYNYDW
jgi:hypothetical protein